MWHSSVNVGLDYLRGLEITELKKEDIPMLWININYSKK